MDNPNKDNKRSERKASRFAKALAKDDAKTGFVTPDNSDKVKKSGEAILSAVVSDPNSTFSDVTKAPEFVKVANKEEGKIKAKAEIVEAQVASGQNEAPKRLFGDGSTVSNVVRTSAQDRPKAEEYYSKADFEREIMKQAQNDNQIAPALAVEKLGLEDYYPNIGKNIAVGSYSGKYLGSATIFAAPGMRLPMGLIDARKRAIAEAAKSKQVAMDKLYEIPDTALQYQDAFQSDYIDWISKGLDEAGGYDEFISNPDNRKEMQRRQTLAKHLTEINTRVSELKEAAQGKDGKQGVHLSDGTRKKIVEYQTGALENLDDILSGKQNVAKFNDYLKSYHNGIVWADDNMKNWNDTITELPMNLKSNKPLTESQMGEISNAVKMIKDGSGDYDSYMDVIKKYVSIDYDTMVNSWADYSGYPVDDDARKDLKDYISSQIKDDSFIANVERQANKNYDYWAKKYDRANELEDKKTLYTQFYENSINNGIEDKVLGARELIKNQPNMSTEEKNDVFAKALTDLGWDVKKEYKVNGKNKIGYVYHSETVTGNERKSYSLAKGRASIELYNKKTGEREFVSVDYANKYPDMFSMTNDEKDVLDTYAKNGDVKVINSERRSYPAYVDNNGNTHKVSSSFLGSYASADEKSIYTETHGSPVVEYKEEVDGVEVVKAKKMNVKVCWGARLDNDLERNAIDTQASDDRQDIAGYKP